MTLITKPFSGVLSGGPGVLGPAGKESYTDKVLGVAPGNLIGYWRMGESSGGDSFDLSPGGYDGAYTGVTLGQPGIGDGRTSPLFDGANDSNDIYNVYKIFDATTNLITNPSLETNATGWTKRGASTVVTRDTNEAKFGSASLSVVVLAEPGRGVYYAFSGAAETEYTVSAWVKVADGKKVKPALYDDVSTFQNGTLITGDGTWQRISVTATTGAGAVTFRLYVNTQDNVAQTFYVDGAQVEARATITDYTDGGLGERYAWTGTAHASTSTRESGGKEGGMMVWFTGDDWDAGGIDYALNLGVDATANFTNINKAADGTIIFYYEAGNTIDSVTSAVQTDDGAFKCCLLTWSLAADELQGFLNGAQVSTTQTGLGTWAGDLASTRAVVGASVTTPSSVLAGKAAHAVLWAGSSAPALLQAAAASLAVV